MKKKCDCPSCERRRRISRNWERRHSGSKLEPDPVLDLPILYKCSCKWCIQRSHEVKKRKMKKNN